jgi:hypothetical protein
LLAVERPQGRLLADHVGTTPILFADAVIVASDGRVLFTDASQRMSARQYGHSTRRCSTSSNTPARAACLNTIRPLHARAS